MPLPNVAEIAAGRAEHEVASAAHKEVHAINELLRELERWEEGYPIPMTYILDGFEERWPDLIEGGLPPVDDPLTVPVFTARLTAASEALTPLGKREHELEHELEDLLKQQYDALIGLDEFAEVKAILDPLYAERAVLFDTLAPAYHRHQLMEAGRKTFEHWLQQTRDMAAKHDEDDHRGINAQVSLSYGKTTLDMLTGTLATFHLEPPYPEPPTLDLDDPATDAAAMRAASEQLLADLEAYADRQKAEMDVFGSKVKADHARWDEINRLIQEHTG